MSFLPSLMLAFAYTFAQENPGNNVSFFILTFPAKFLPYAMLFMTFVMAGPEGAKHQATGLIAAHLYDFLTRIWPTFGGGTNPIQTPIYIQQLFGEGQGTRTGTVRSHGTAFASRAQPVPAAGGSARSGGTFTSGSSWNSMGQGRRLGGD
jgi:Derlin-2/3